MYKSNISRKILYPIIGIGFYLSSCSDVEPIINNQGKAQDLNGDSIPELLDKKTGNIYYSNKTGIPLSDSSVVRTFMFRNVEYNLIKGNQK